MLVVSHYLWKHCRGVTGGQNKAAPAVRLDLHWMFCWFELGLFTHRFPLCMFLCMWEIFILLGSLHKDQFQGSVHRQKRTSCTGKTANLERIQKIIFGLLFLLLSFLQQQQQPPPHSVFPAFMVSVEGRYCLSNMSSWGQKAWFSVWMLPQLYFYYSDQSGLLRVALIFTLLWGGGGVKRISRWRGGHCQVSRASLAAGSCWCCWFLFHLTVASAASPS